MKAVILAGGEGRRLDPLTRRIPKPLLPLAGTCVIEHQLAQLRRHGCDEVFISTRHLGSYLEAFLGDGSRFGVQLRYLEEAVPLGTCGPLKILEGTLEQPFLVLNGDVLTTTDLSSLYDAALKSGLGLLVVTATSEIQVRFGVVTVDSAGNLRSLDEKPLVSMEVVAGIYVISPNLLPMIPSGTQFDMDDMILKLQAAGQSIATYHIEEWVEIGDIADLQRGERFLAHQLVSSAERT